MRTAATRWAAVRMLMTPVGYEAVLMAGGGRGGGVRPADPQREALRPGGRPARMVRPYACL